MALLINLFIAFVIFITSKAQNITNGVSNRLATNAFLSNLTAMEDSYHPLIEEEHHHEYIHYGKFYTTLSGAPIGDKLNSITAGKKGPILLEDSQLLEELGHFNRERIPERVVHAVGAGAFGYFEVTNHIISAFTKASLFHKVGKKTHIAVRFSTAIGARGSADTARDPRGFAIKFYTDEGNWDMVGLNFPVFFVRDPLRFINFIHSQKPDPHNNLKNYDYFWDFISLMPETLHAVSYLFTDLGTPHGYRHMHGFSVSTYKLVNDQGKVVFARFHLLTEQGIKNLTMEEAKRLAAHNPQWAAHDLFEAIKHHEFPSWKLFIQLMSPKAARKWHHNPFDPTKVWPLEDFPLVEAGKLTLTHNPKNFFADIEQLAFNPSNLVPGIEATTDRIFQGRILGYGDAERYRLGTNFHKIPVNKPMNNIVSNNVRDGSYCYDSNDGHMPNYYPNSFDGKKVDFTEKDSKWKLPTGVDIKRHDSTDKDNYSQVGQFWDSLNEEDKASLIFNMAMHLCRAKKMIRDKVIHHFRHANSEYGDRLHHATEHHECPEHDYENVDRMSFDLKRKKK